MEEIRKPTIRLMKNFCRLMVETGVLCSDEAIAILKKLRYKPVPISKQQKTYKKLITRKECARRMDLHVATLDRQFLNTGLLPCYRFGGSVKIDENELDKFLESMKLQADVTFKK